MRPVVHQRLRLLLHLQIRLRACAVLALVQQHIGRRRSVLRRQVAAQRKIWQKETRRQADRSSVVSSDRDDESQTDTKTRLGV